MNLGETLSSDTLFHFTSKREYLVNIIENGFSPRYCTEDFSAFSSVFGSDTKYFDFGVPMLCFCDIPLSKVKEHISVYKGYGIGCTKAWGIERGVTPVIYAKPASETVQGIQNALVFLQNISNISADNASKIGSIRDNLMRMMKYVKSYEGRFEHNGQIFEKKRFYDEREWRYVPNFSDEETNAFPSWISKELLLINIPVANLILKRDEKIWPQGFFGDIPWIYEKLQNTPQLRDQSEESLVENLYEKLRQELNSIILETQSLSLQVDPLTIKYIIVEQEVDFVPIADVLDKKFRDGYSSTTLKRLMGRIITLEQIRDDF